MIDLELKEYKEWKEIKDLSEQGRVKSVYEMMPKMSTTNLRRHWGSPKLTEEHFSIIENCLRLDFTITEACDAAWVSLSSYYNYYKNDEDFALRMDRAKNFPKQMARTAVMKRIWQWDAKTALRYLELRDKNRYNTELWMNEDWEQDVQDLPKVQFISVPSKEWADQQTNDSQTPTNQKSASDTSASFSEKVTPWENEEDALRRLAS